MNTTHLYRFVKASERLPEGYGKYYFCIIENKITGDKFKGVAYKADTRFDVDPSAFEVIEWQEELPTPSTDDALKVEAAAEFQMPIGATVSDMDSVYSARKAYIKAIQLERARAKGTQERDNEQYKENPFGAATLFILTYLSEQQQRNLIPWLHKILPQQKASVSTETAGILTPREFVEKRMKESLRNRGLVGKEFAITVVGEYYEYASSRSLKDGELIISQDELDKIKTEEYWNGWKAYGESL